MFFLKIEEVVIGGVDFKTNFLVKVIGGNSFGVSG